MIKYPYQAALLNFFKGNQNAVIMPGLTVEDYIKMLKLNQPPTVWQNILMAFGFYIIFILGGYFSLKFLYKERR